MASAFCSRKKLHPVAFRPRLGSRSRWHFSCSPRPRMHKTGLLALADTYGLDRRELQHLKMLADAFFNDLREQLTACAGTPIRLSSLAQSVSSFKEVCAEVPLCQLVFLGSDHTVA